MRAHVFPVAGGTVSLRRFVDALNARSLRDGLHVLEGWDYRAHKFPDDIVPVLLLDYCARLGIPADEERSALAILLDQYFLSLLMLVAVRSWDSGDPNANLDRVTALLDLLHGPGGSGLRVVENANTLLLLAIAYYNPEEKSFEVFMNRIRTLDESQQLRVALPFAGILGSHLRWGLRFMYRRDIGLMRADNVVDYPMLLFTVLTLVRAYSRACEGDVAMSPSAGGMQDSSTTGLLSGAAEPGADLSVPTSTSTSRAPALSSSPATASPMSPALPTSPASPTATASPTSPASRSAIAEGLLNALAADPWAFTGSLPPCMAGLGDDHAECRTLLARHRDRLMEDFIPHEPSLTPYSPLAFSCSFLSNAAVATVAIAMHGGADRARQQPSLNALFAREREGGGPHESTGHFAERLMEFSSASPDRLGAGGVPVIVNDKYDAVYWYNEVRRTLRATL
jgi:hypothetical protein